MSNRKPGSRPPCCPCGEPLTSCDYYPVGPVCGLCERPLTDADRAALDQWRKQRAKPILDK